MNKIKIYFLFLVLLLISKVLSQGEAAVPFLLIEPSARVNGMAGSFTAVANDANAIYYNPAGISDIKYGSFEYSKYDLFENRSEPYLCNLSATFTLKNIGSFGIHRYYFYLGENILTDEVGNELGELESKEWALSVSYAKRLSPYTSLGGSFKIIRSELKSIQVGSNTGPGSKTGFAFDLGVLFSNFLPDLCYKRRFFDFKYQQYLQHRTFTGPSIGIVLKNIGPHINYIGDSEDPLPQQLRIGAAWYMVDTDIISLMIASDLRKLLVKRDIEGADHFYQAWFTSWKGFSLNRFQFSAGVEITLFYILTLRTGRYLESERDGGNKYWSYGFSIGPETLRLHWYHTEYDNRPYEETRWYFGISVVY